MANDKHDDDAERKRREDEEKRQRDQQQRQRREAQRSPADKAAADKQQAEQREAQAAASIGAQVILDYNEDGSKGARGAFPTMSENVQARDAHLVAVGLDPQAPSGPPLGSEEALRKAQEARAPQPQFMPAPSGKATRMSSLAAGINAADLPEPPPTSTIAGGAA